MNTQPVRKKRIELIVSLGLTLILGGSITILAYSPLGQKFDADAWLNITTPLLLIVAYALLIKSNWHKWRRLQKILMGIIAFMVVLLFFASLYLQWPRLPWGQAGAFQAADTFMSNLKDKDYTAARQQLTPVAQRNIIGFGGAKAQPASWQLMSMDNDSIITGTAIFVDGTELPITLRMQWLNGHWQIYGVTFGDEFDDLRIDFMMCCDSGW